MHSNCILDSVADLLVRHMVLCFYKRQNTTRIIMSCQQLVLSRTVQSVSNHCAKCYFEIFAFCFWLQDYAPTLSNHAICIFCSYWQNILVNS